VLCGKFERRRQTAVSVFIVMFLWYLTKIWVGGGGVDFNKIITLIICTRGINFQNHDQNALVLCAIPVGLMLNKHANFLKY